MKVKVELDAEAEEIRDLLFYLANRTISDDDLKKAKEKEAAWRNAIRNTRLLEIVKGNYDKERDDKLQEDLKQITDE